MTQNWKEDFDNNFTRDGEWKDISIAEIKNFIESLLAEQRLSVLEEVKREVEKELEKWDESAEELEDGWGNYTVCLPWELKEKKVDISTIINQLKVK